MQQLFEKAQSDSVYFMNPNINMYNAVPSLLNNICFDSVSVYVIFHQTS